MSDPATAPTEAARQKTARWGDLVPRLLSALVMVAIGGGAIWAGGLVFVALALVASGVMMWELSRITAGGAAGTEVAAQGSDISWLLGLLTAGVLALNLFLPSPWPAALLLLPTLVGLMAPRRDPWAFGLYSMVIVLTGLSLVLLRGVVGLEAVLCLVVTVIASDVAGYFAGRLLGGPKFWPRISPKKTWSGTIAGWIAAALVGFGFWAFGQGGAQLIWILPLIAFAGQLGDIAESAIKRRAGVKDASQLIPGHGGLMDRFDALAFVVILAMILQILVPFLPMTGA